jgi:hypothetical protein
MRRGLSDKRSVMNEAITYEKENMPPQIPLRRTHHDP